MLNNKIDIIIDFYNIIKEDNNNNNSIFILIDIFINDLLNYYDNKLKNNELYNELINNIFIYENINNICLLKYLVILLLFINPKSIDVSELEYKNKIVLFEIRNFSEIKKYSLKIDNLLENKKYFIDKKYNL